MTDPLSGRDVHYRGVAWWRVLHWLFPACSPRTSRLFPGVPSQTDFSTGTTVSGSASEGSRVKALPWISVSSVQNEEGAKSSLGESHELKGVNVFLNSEH